MPRTEHRLLPYDPSWGTPWDDGVVRARNGHFMFRRGYLDYHADRFDDSSSLLLRGSKLVALLPAHRQGVDLVSHRGLSFGGWLLSPDCLYGDLEAGFSLLGHEMKRQGLRRLVYSPSPYPYHQGACGDDLYLLQKLGGRCDSLRLAAFLANPSGLPSGKKFRQRLRGGEAVYPCRFEETADVERFWPLLTAFLAQRHGALPVHGAGEMALLRERFPDAIRLVIGHSGDDWLTGAVLFLTPQVLRFQYIFQQLEEPQALFADRLIHWAIGQEDLARPWIDFGTSMDPGSGELTPSLHLHKEILGARGLCLSTWTWEP